MINSNKPKEKTALQQLQELAKQRQIEKYPLIPFNCLGVEKFSDTTSNGLTKCIIKYIQLNGWQAERISVTGRFIDNTEIVKDVLGHKRTIGSKQFIPSSMNRGSADISATILGFSVKVEVKIGNDKQSEAQKDYQKAMRRAGGIYLIARDFSSFKTWFDSFIEGGN